MVRKVVSDLLSFLQGLLLASLYLFLASHFLPLRTWILGPEEHVVTSYPSRFSESSEPSEPSPPSEVAPPHHESPPRYTERRTVPLERHPIVENEPSANTVKKWIPVAPEKIARGVVKEPAKTVRPARIVETPKRVETARVTRPATRRPARHAPARHFSSPVIAKAPVVPPSEPLDLPEPVRPVAPPIAPREVAPPPIVANPGEGKVVVSSTEDVSVEFNGAPIGELKANIPMEMTMPAKQEVLIRLRNEKLHIDFSRRVTVIKDRRTVVAYANTRDPEDLSTP